MKKYIFLFSLSLLLRANSTAGESDLAGNFARPPADARPWVYWFWNNGNVTSNGITADLEAMQRNGIGGVLIMDVFERFAPPRGSAEFMNREWRGLFQFSVQEAARLGLEINMANGPGWCGSSGPWITPAMSMQQLVYSNLTITGPSNLTCQLPRAKGDNRKRDGYDSKVETGNYYRDVAVLAYPVKDKGVILRDEVLDISAKMDASGTLHWQVPAGNWVIQRIVQVTTCASTRPPVAGGNGLECDKLSADAMDLQFKNMMGRLIANAGTLAGKSLVATHIDSWEVGSQNWTPDFRSEFKRRRGYDVLPWLPALTGAIRQEAIDPGEKNTLERVRWDFSQTRAELLAENYSGRLAKLAHKNRLRYTIEGYDLPFGDQFTYTARADEPMTEFWTGSRCDPGFNDVRIAQAASVAHVYGRAVVGAEAFTSGDGERWKLTPADIKSLGDFQFTRGVNRFVVHRYAHQPYLDRFPGVTMGPWGLHYERTQTWWEMSLPWHEYLARCQYLLRQGTHVADLLYLRPEQPDQKFFNPNPPPPAGFRYDEISAEALLDRATVKNSRVCLEGGMSYGVLVLPPAKTMTPELAAKIRELVRAGATVFATAAGPKYSPSLHHYPKCDKSVSNLSHEIWGDCDGQKITAHTLGKGKLIWGRTLATVLADQQMTPDFFSDVELNWIHRQSGRTEIYYVANPLAVAVEAKCHFRVNGLQPELWNPETGAITPLITWQRDTNGITLPLRLEASGSAFIIFRRSDAGTDPIVSLRYNDQPLPAPPPTPPHLEILQATYGVPGNAARSRDVRAEVQALVNSGQTTFEVSSLAKAGDPALNIVKTLTVEYQVAGEKKRATGKDAGTIFLQNATSAPERPADLVCKNNGQLALLAYKPGVYEWITASGKSHHLEITSAPAPQEISGPWQLEFAPHWGAPAQTTFTNLISWSDSADIGIKHYSGTATYRTVFDCAVTNGSPVQLDLGAVKAMAQVRLNGQDCGIAWKQPFRVDVTKALRPGRNELEVRVANLWPNRMIGDADLPPEKRFTWSSWEPFNAKTPLLPSGLLGPVKLLSAQSSGFGQ